MTHGAPPLAWLKWLLLGALIGCLNPHPDDEPMLLDTPSTMPDGKGAPSGGNTGASDGPPLPIGVDQGNGEPRDPIRETPPVEGADAGVPSRDAGADAGPG